MLTAIKSKTFLLEILLVLVLLAGIACAHKARYVFDDAELAQPREWQNVKVYTVTDIGKAYEVVGLVSSNIPSSDGDRAKETVQKEAAELGADAIVNFKLTLQAGRAVANGRAVRFK